MTKRPQTLGEEITNSVSHGVALLAAVASVPFLMASTRNLSAASFIGAIVFSSTMVLLYLTSALYPRATNRMCKTCFL